MDTLVLRGRYPWNKGILVGQKRPLQPKNVWPIRVRLEMSGAIRELALFNLAIDSKLRACDLVKLRVEDLWSGSSIRDRATIIQKKTNGPCSLRSPSRRRPHWRRGFPLFEGTAAATCFQAVGRRRSTCRRGSMPALSIAGSRLSDSTLAPMAPTRCGAPRQHRFTRRRAIFGPSRFCSVTLSWKAPSATLASK